ncbi:MAG: type II secretion system F family protein [Planctomycetaceae bacterium]|nr:type II secretion system F family protein [Planctomycetaceae bacterium]
MNPLLIAAMAFVGVAALVGGLALLWRDKPVQKIESRLEMLTGVGAARSGLNPQASILSQPLDDRPGFVESFLARFGNISLLFEQADTNLTTSKLTLISGALVAMGVGVGVVARIHIVLLPLVAGLMGSLPLMWLLMRRKRRLKTFASQLPDALEMIARTLRAGQSLGFGFNLVATEMPAPISKEFGRVFEEQNLGVPLEESLHGMTERVPNLDLQFFVTALVLQRQTGGDLAEILDKIGNLIRDRFRIWGQVQALTGEGRLSGTVLLALPFVLFIAVYQLNPDYVSVLFTDPAGTKMLAAAVFMQILGALVIRKIVNIKV